MTAAAVAVVAAAALCLAVVAPSGAAEATAWRGHADRTLVRHEVQPGETATALAVRYHAWTAELIALNHLGSGGALRRGQVIWIPVVVSAARRAGQHVQGRHRHAHGKHRHGQLPLLLHRTTPPRGWRDAGLDRLQVHDLVVRMARHFGVPPRLALAIAWQESGWQQRRVSGDGALGVMQVLPGTGSWMRWYAGRRLRLRDTHDNIQAGVLTLRTLRSWTKKDVTAIAAYYQGLGSVRRRGWFDDTRTYVRAVLAHERSLRRTGSPR